MRDKLRELWCCCEALLITAALLAIGCDRTDAALAALSAEDAQWSARLGALRSRQGDLATRVAGWQSQRPASAAKPADAIKWQARVLRAQASVEGSRQTLADLDARRTEIVREVQEALERDGLLGEELFGRERAQMAQYLAAEEQELIATDKAVADLAAPGRSL